MGLDKQPCPPKRKVVDENEEKKEDSCKDDTNHKRSEICSSVGYREVHKDIPSPQFPAAAGGRKEYEEMEVEATKEKIKSDEYGNECEKNRSSTSDNGRLLLTLLHTYSFSTIILNQDAEEFMPCLYVLHLFPASKPTPFLLTLIVVSPAPGE